MQLFSDIDKITCLKSDLHIKEFLFNKKILQIEEVVDLQIGELFVDHRIVYKSREYLICKSKKYLWIEEKSLIFRLKKYLICRLKNYMQIDELQIEEVFNLRMGELYADRRNIEVDRRTIFNWITIFADQRTIFDLQIEELSADGRTIYRSKNYLQIEELYANWRIVYKSKKYWSADWRMVCRLRNYLQMKELPAD